MELQVNRVQPVTSGNHQNKDTYSRGADIKQAIFRDQQGQGLVAHFKHTQAENLQEKTVVNNLENSEGLEKLADSKDYQPGSLFLAKA